MEEQSPPHLRLKLRILFGEAMLGPGKADLLALIRDTGSISQAARQMQMSYKRAWMLVEELNAMFRVPLVESLRGGAHGGGARLTETGAEVLALYRSFEARSAQAPEIAALQALAGDISGGK
ncbi:winged helix-turn-helix domain-containing protein [Rhodobacter ferrooxidans]|uniref:Putative transcriptional regulator, ModE family n=1 Tax=Rhodobacter ferrooxidans TaxID=371731 RepID=C8S183_9RHOB|nr:LysR family transcriptional regulator [Rhodobacter sp. SW2]EEW25281.1 putative transcriptional regulator, ModE family [Rhodobacter sp. SW2]